jgi:hypothetical protein
VNNVGPQTPSIRVTGTTGIDSASPHSGFAAYDIYQQPQASQLHLNTTFNFPYDMEPQISPYTTSIQVPHDMVKHERTSSINSDSNMPTPVSIAGPRSPLRQEMPSIRVTGPGDPAELSAEDTTSKPPRSRPPEDTGLRKRVSDIEAQSQKSSTAASQVEVKAAQLDDEESSTLFVSRDTSSISSNDTDFGTTHTRMSSTARGEKEAESQGDELQMAHMRHERLKKVQEHLTEVQQQQAVHLYDGSNVAPPSSQEVQWTDSHYGTSRSSDNDSGYGSYAASVLSTGSLNLAATELSRNTGYSSMQIARATEELIIILQDDTDLAPLYKQAISDTSIGPERLERNLRRLFKGYADQLSKISSDTLEFLASKLVREKAGAVARSIIEKHNSIVEASDLEWKQEQAQSSDDDDDDDDDDGNHEKARPVDETMFDDLIVFREFLVGSEAFTTLHAQIRSFILPSMECRDSIEVPVNDLGNDAPPPPVNGPVAKAVARVTLPVSVLYWAKSTKHLASAALIAAGWLESPLKPGFTRLRWQCVSISLFPPEH